MAGRHRVSVDIGGTFTDVVVQDADGGHIVTGKVLSTPSNAARAVLEGIRRFVPDGAPTVFLIHGTTVGLNAVITRRGAKVGLITTEGFRDVYPIGGNDRRDLFDIRYRKPRPLLPPEAVLTVPERLAADGSVLREPSPADLDAAVAAVRENGVEAVAVCLLFSYLNPVHELAVGEHLAARLPDVPVSLSHRLSREWREYARTSTAVMNAYIAPVVTRYLDTLIAELEGELRGRPLHVMASGGGAVTARAAREAPIQTLLSGPVGGSVGAVALSETVNRPDLICIDMGGTSFDACLVVDGQPSVSPETEVEGLPVQMSAVDIHTIGAGGGSIAWLEGDALRVGPHSAGADPGPACYGRGGTELTVTDANLVLGRIDQRRFAGGGIGLSTEAAREATARIAGPLGMEVDRLAEGVLDIVNAKMADAIRTITVGRGIDPRRFALVAYGGAGPMHAAFLAEQLEIGEVLVPAHPGTFSAWGMLQTDIRHDLQTTWFRPLGELDETEVEAAFKQLEGEGAEMLDREGVAPEDMRSARGVDMRYGGQEYFLTVPVPAGGFDAAATRARFDTMYERRYGHASPQAPAELVNLRLAATGVLATPPVVTPEPAPRTDRPVREVRFGGQPLPTPVAPREELAAGDQVRGPAIIEEPTATTIVPPGWVAHLVPGGHLSLTQEG